MDRFDWFNKRNRAFTWSESEYKTGAIEHSKLTEYFEKTITKKPKYAKQNYTKILKTYDNRDNKISLTEQEEYIRNLAYDYLTSIGLNQNKNHFMIEYWRHRLSGETKKSHLLPTHRDSFGVILAPVNTCIFYLRRDPTFRGSQLQLWGLYGRFASRPLYTIEPDNKVLMFDGGVFHKVLPFSGFGVRDCIVVQFSRE
jgi:hypothetical protein